VSTATVDDDASQWTRLVLTGEFDADARATYDRAIADLDVDRPVRIDMRAVTFMDSSGLHALLHLTQIASQRLCLVGISDRVRRILEITETPSLFDLAD